jgi:hypothetical protein
MRARVVCAAMAVALTLACATTGGGGGPRPASPNKDIILESEIEAIAGRSVNALQVIEKLRPQMLRSRGAGSPTDASGETSQPKVYVDNIAYGDISTLTNLNATQIREIQFFKSGDATTRWGTGHMGGVILVTMKTR